MKMQQSKSIVPLTHFSEAIHVTTPLSALSFLLSILLTIACGLLCVTESSAQTTDSVYEDSLAAEWNPGFWDCDNNVMQHASSLAQDEIVHSGSFAIEVSHACPDGWGGFGLERRSLNWEQRYWMYPNQYKKLDFYFNPGESIDSIQALQITLDNGSPRAFIIDYLPQPVTPNTWYQVTIPFEDLNSKGGRFFRFYFWNESNNHPHYYIDDVSLEWEPDTTAPTISELKVSDITYESATVTWKTDEYTLCTFSYGVDGLTTSIDETDFKTEHSIALNDLQASTTYQFHILARDHQVDPLAASNTAEASGELTTAPPDVVAPVISNVHTTGIKSNQATVCWDTDELSDSRVSFGVGDYSSETASDDLTSQPLCGPYRSQV